MDEHIKSIIDKYGDMNLIDMVHTYLKQEREEHAQKRLDENRTGKYYPSSVGQCKRKVVYQMLGYPQGEIDGRNLLIMENGTYFHNRMEDLFSKMGIMIAPELSLKDEELRISGRSDAIIWNFINQDKVKDLYTDEITLKDKEENVVYQGPASDVLIVEFKSIKDRGYEEYVPKTKPKREHEMQLQLYFYLTGIRQGLVYYEDKDNQNQKYFHITYNEQLVNEIVGDIRFIIQCIDEGKLPDREFEPTSFQCRYCDFRDICHPVKKDYDLDAIF